MANKSAAPDLSARLVRERRTIAAMMGIFCRGVHLAGHGLCADCQELLAYAHGRIERCPFGADKPTCAKCLIHCYQAKQRERIREVMRYAGPRMLLHRPLLTLLHYWDSTSHPRCHLPTAGIPREKR